MDLLYINGIHKRFGGLQAIKNLSFSINRGEILGIIGHNGAGKTTLFNIITGVLKPDSGKIIFLDEDITGKSTAKIAGTGIVRTFQASIMFDEFTVYKNLYVAHHLHNRAPFWGFLLNTSSVREKERAIEKKIEELLEFSGLTAVQNELPSNLPYGYQRALSICIALAAEPKVLLLDEPVTGMNEVETASMVAHIKSIRDKGITIIIIEHDMKAIMGLSNRIVALSAGQKIAEGPPEDIQKNKDVIESYLGKDEEF